MCLICKKYEHNARGHYKFVKAGESSSSHYLEAISPAEEASNDGDYLNMYSLEMWNNNHQGLNLAYQHQFQNRLFKRKVMKEYIVEVQKKKKIGNHSKV
ncbi:hypothetical protein H5410_033897 [Solanum commersonii]|uniref:Uncharacterized protein n=1 Tax=Solanum commersonii TaxID=4109 RepID=A0A9J5YRY1_SOLCO|nr:hypothetical protein H5410_033897 [Solanum commersonii]